MSARCRLCDTKRYPPDIPISFAVISPELGLGRSLPAQLELPRFQHMDRVMNDEQKPELDDFGPRNLEEYADRLWQQRVKTERESAESDDDVGSYSPTRDYYDTYYHGDTDTFKETFEYGLKRPTDEPLSPLGSTPGPAKKSRGRPYKSVSVKITCLKPEDKVPTTFNSDLVKLQEEGLGVPKCELAAGGLRMSSKLPLTWTADDMRSHIHSLFPRVQSFVYMKCTSGKNLDPLPEEIKPADLRHLLGRSGLYIVPIGALLPKESERSTPRDPFWNAAATTTTPVHTSTSYITEAPASSTNSKHYWLPTKVSGEKVVSNEEEFRITLDISNFSPNEISLKTKNNRVMIHAKHEEREDEYGLIEREFKRQYILPKDVDPLEVTSSLSPLGILTLKAPKMNTDNGKERIIPLHFTHEEDS